MRIQTKYAAHVGTRGMGAAVFRVGPEGYDPSASPCPTAGMVSTFVPSSIHSFISPAGPSHVTPATQAAGAGRKRSTRHCQRTRRFSQPRMALAGRTTQQEERGGPRARAASVQIPALPPAPSLSDLASDMITLRLSLSVRERESNSTLLTGDYENSLS